MKLVRLLIRLLGDRDCTNCRFHCRKQVMLATMSQPGPKDFCDLNKPMYEKCKYHKFGYYIVEFKK